MAATTYQYSVPNDFPNQKVDVGRLTEEIQDNEVVVHALEGILVYGPETPPRPWCDITFKAALDPSEEVALDTIVATHSGEPLPYTEKVVPSDEEGNPLTQPKFEADRRMVVVNFPGTEGTMLWITGAGDNLSPTPPDTGRGTGTPIVLEWTGPEEKTLELDFLEWIEIHDGRLFNTPIDNWTPADKWSFGARLPATTVVEMPEFDGNCRVVNEQGVPGPPDDTHYIIVPAAGDGSYQVDLSSATPVPAGMAANGFWDVNKLTEEITVSNTPGAAEWQLLTMDVMAYFMRSIPMGNPLGVFDFDAYKAEWISSKWKIHLTVNKVSAGAGKIGGWIVVFREYSN